MDCQDWNTITFNNQGVKQKQEQNNKSLSQKQTPQDIKLEAAPNLGKLIAQARANKTRQQVATSLGVALSLFTRWETGKDIPSNSDIAKIERNLGVKLPRNKKVKVDN